ncbi:MAG TPA: ABC transporter permease [Terriglobales bacterium]|nr:ABC transporter permease [Terriglobales bacterium]
MEIIRNLVEGRLRTTLAIGGVVAGVLALTLTSALAEHFDAQVAGGVAYYRSSIQVADSAGNYAGVISLSKVDPIQKLPGVAAALPTITLLAKPGTTAITPLGLPDTIVYADPRERALSPLKTRLAAGHPLDPNHQGEVVLGADLANEFRVRVGDSLDLPVRPPNPNPDFVNHTFHVVGILQRTRTLPDAMASVGLLDAQALLQESLPASFRDRVDPSSLASVITVYGKRGTDLDRLADQITAKVAGVSATRPSDYVRGFDQGAALDAVAVVAGGLTVLFAGLVLVDTMLIAVAERSREIALKMLLGARAWQVAAEHVLEALLLGLLGGLIGFALGVGLSNLLDLAGRSIGMDIFSVSDHVAKITLGLTVALGLAGGIVPALRAARMDAGLALRAR